MMAHVSQAGDRAVVFVFRLEASQSTFQLRLPGLVDGADYLATFSDGRTIRLKGSDSSAGIEVSIDEEYGSERIAFELLA